MKNDVDGSWVPVPEHLEIVKREFSKSPICLPPPHGYARRDNFSKQSLEWIMWYEKQHGVKIQHALSLEGEMKVSTSKGVGYSRVPYSLDGYYEDDEGNGHALEFNGCWFHGCPTCYPRDRSNLRVSGKNMDVRYAETLNKEEFLRREKAMTVHSMWSCEWEMTKKRNPEIVKFVETIDMVDPIDLRDPYFGGRTNGIVLHKDISLPMKGLYKDFCSLYPDVLKYMTYPLGHPVRIVENFKDCVQDACSGPCFRGNACHGKHIKLPYFGLIKARVLPPRKLLFPVLPMRINKKLMFTLCKKCAESESDAPCACTSVQRSLTHTWTTVEMDIALNMGYEILKIYEVLHWAETSTLDRLTGSGGLFTQYINTFLRIKAEASGYPKDAKTENEKKKYVEDYAINEGVQLRSDCITKNPGLRSIAKLALNSFYGKFGQRTNMKKCCYITSCNDIYRLLTDYTKVIKDFHVLNTDMVVFDYVEGREFQETDSKTNVVIATFCTSYARLKLWLVLNRLGERVLYHDTDSVIYTSLPGQYCPPVGKYLGQLTDELECKEIGCLGCSEGHWIVEFVSCGAKNYAYKLNTGEVVCKVRGFSLNFSASQVVNLDSMKKALMLWKKKEEQMEMTTIKTMILRNKYTGVVYSKEMPKNYGVVYNKRVVAPDFTTKPYGF